MLEPEANAPAKAVPLPEDLSAPVQERLVVRAIKGDRQALQELCQAKARGILFRTQRILSNRMDAEDVAQEVLLKICTKIGDVRDPRAFNGWMNTILLHETRQMMIKNSKSGTVLNLSEYLASIEEEDEDFLPVEYTLREEERKAVIDVMDRLSDRQREAVLLHYFDGLNVSQTADTMGISQQAASRYLKLARQKLKAELTKPDLATPAAARLAAMPAGPLMAAALAQSAKYLAIEDGIWLAKALDILTPHLARNPLRQLAAKLTTAALAGSAVLTVAIGIWLFTSQEAPAAPTLSAKFIPAQDIRGSVTFNGADPLSPEVNPTLAEAQASSEHGQMVALYWWITDLAGGEVIAEGKGSVASEPLLKLGSEGPEGSYLMVFRMQDSLGQTYTLSRVFTIQSPGGLGQ